MLNTSLFPPEEKALVAVSGGGDSVGLLHLLCQSQNISTLVVGHVHHGLRKESDEEFDFVKALAERLGLEFCGKKLEEKPSGETSAREARYKALTEMAQKTGCTRIVTAHHKQDQLETRLMNLMRGCSPKGLTGIQEQRLLESGLLLVRPALKVDKAQLLDAAKKWREDASNKKANNPRNILRLNIIPEMQKLAPRDLAASLESLVALLEDDLAALDVLVPEANILSLEAWTKLPIALQRRWLRKAAKLEKEQIERGLKAALQQKSADLGRGVHLHISQGTISLRH